METLPEIMQSVLRGEDMTTEITVFKDKKILTEVVGGEPCFCLKDICDEVEIKNVGNVIKRLHDSGIRTMDVGIQTETGLRAMAFVNEAGLYEVIGKSRKPRCKELFQQLITALPELRKQAITPLSSPWETIRAMAQGMIDLEQRMDKYEAKQQAVIAVLEPVKEVPVSGRINQVVRDYAFKYELPYRDCWHKLYYEFKYRYNVDLLLRATNRGVTGVQIAEELGMSGELLGLAIYLFTK
jgi:prophage antirepressor-like protein